MTRIGICNMGTDFVEQVKNILSDILDVYIEWDVELFDDAQKVIEAIDAHCFHCDLLFLDIYQRELDKVDLAFYVKEHDLDTEIIFVTTSIEHVFSCYQGHAFAYLLKPLQEKDIRQELTRYFRESQIAPRCLRIQSKGRRISIPLDIILFLESKSRKILIHTRNQIFEYYAKLDELEAELSKEGFLRCHQSYLVPVAKIEKFAGMILTVSGIDIPVSRKYKDKVYHAIYQAELAAALPGQVLSKRQYDHCGRYQLNDTKGSLICVEGDYLGKIVRLVPEQTIVVGRANETADMIVNLPQVSRVHCKIIYHQKENFYEVVDCSANGTFMGDGTRLKRGDTYAVKPGCSIVFGDKSAVYRFG